MCSLIARDSQGTDYLWFWAQFWTLNCKQKTKKAIKEFFAITTKLPPLLSSKKTRLIGFFMLNSPCQLFHLKQIIIKIVQLVNMFWCTSFFLIGVRGCREARCRWGCADLASATLRVHTGCHTAWDTIHHCRGNVSHTQVRWRLFLYSRIRETNICNIELITLHPKSPSDHFVPLFPRIVWFLLVSGAFSFFIYYAYGRISVYLSYPKNVNVEVNYLTKVRFPAVTFCNQNTFRWTFTFDFVLSNSLVQPFWNGR